MPPVFGSSMNCLVSCCWVQKKNIDRTLWTGTCGFFSTKRSVLIFELHHCCIYGSLEMTVKVVLDVRYDRLFLAVP
jgi:hypothetical protein